MHDPESASERLKKKQEEIDRRHAAEVAAVERRLAESYRESYKAIEAELAKLFASSEGDINQARKYGRLKAMEDAIDAEYKKLTGKTIRETETSAAQSYAMGAYGNRWAIDEATGVDIRWPILPVNAIRESVNSEIAGEDFRTRTIYNEAYSAEQARRHVTQGLATGAGYAKTARKMRDDVDISYSDAVRIVRTESERDFTLGKLRTTDNLKDMGIESRKQWVSTNDDRVREDHFALDGEYADENGQWNLGGEMVDGPGLSSDPGQSINCRCTYIDVIGDYAPEFHEVYADGTYSSASYTEWAESQGWTAKDGWPKAKGVKK
jgi:SPP1 gp7 family putative phage head morphogenesis protein